MSGLTPWEFAYLADVGRVRLDVLPPIDVELYERVIPWSSSIASVGFTKVRVFAEGDPDVHERTVPVGSLYQARIYRRGSIADGAQPGHDDVPLGRVDIPAIVVETRENLLTTCRADRANVALDVGGNYLRMSLATGHEATRLALFVGDVEPSLLDFGQGPVPRFTDHEPIAAAPSDRSASVHRLVAPLAGSSPDKISPGQSLSYIALVWTQDGRWDFIWSETRNDQTPDHEADDGTPSVLTALTRTIEVEVRQLTCVDDDLFEDSEPTFTLALEADGGAALVTDTFTWKDMSSGSVSTSHMSVQWTGASETDASFVSITADPLVAAQPIPLPIADGAPFRVTRHRLKGAGLGGRPGFFADVTVTVSYP